ncbi:hypothetical protein L3073_02315 [Ancylomarina sp. DW003]|nr:hypothetical protein [Ancylomarina sp. DW003]MDE5421037.1 hypothetical protein [Ancylomarina sp. DW003]
MKSKKTVSTQNSKTINLLNEEQILDVENLLKVEGGVDNDEDWCIVGQCKSSAQQNCYTGA